MACGTSGVLGIAAMWVWRVRGAGWWNAHEGRSRRKALERASQGDLRTGGETSMMMVMPCGISTVSPRCGSRPPHVPGCDQNLSPSGGVAG